jgi:CheY-like chemotaxis protein
MGISARVLIVEDDLANQQTLSALLTVLGHTATVAERGDEALRMLQSEQALDVVISDVVMPGMNGIDFARRARETRPGMPIVLVTGKSDVLDSVLESGAVALLKPYSSDALRQVLCETLAEGPS